MYTAIVNRSGQTVAKLSRESRPYDQNDANDYPGCELVSGGSKYLSEPTIEISVPETLSREDVEEARTAIARAKQQASKSSSTVLRDAVIELASTFDLILAKLEQM